MKGEVHVGVKISKSARILPEGKAIFRPLAFSDIPQNKVKESSVLRNTSQLVIEIEGATYLIEWDPRTRVS